MISLADIIYLRPQTRVTLPLKETNWKGVKRARARRKLMRRIYTASIGIFAFALGGIIGPYIPSLRLKTAYKIQQMKILASKGQALRGYISLLSGKTVETSQDDVSKIAALSPIPVKNPLQNEDGSIIIPFDEQFGLIIPKIGINAKVIASINPANPKEYQKALLEGVAHASTSYLPDQDGTVYLFSHSTNYDWFVKDLNAVFYLLKNLNEGDTVIIMYKGLPYSYKITDKRIVSPTSISYLMP